MTGIINDTKKRIDSIDVLRGIVMIIMAIDHLRDFLHIDAELHDPLDLTTTNPILFFTRWITHFCAPTFVFLSGVSIYLQSLRKSNKELTGFLIKRGIWLVFAEIFIVSFAASFLPFYNLVFLQVIWSIGISMILLGLLIPLGFNVILILGLIIVFGHNLLDISEATAGFKSNVWWDILHHGGIYHPIKNSTVWIFYPFVPWTGLMMIGYCVGVFFSNKYTSLKRQKVLTWLGIGSLLFFVVVRFSNIYGDPQPWTVQKSELYTVFSFIKVNKYPPSLLYMTMTIGVALLILALLENVHNKFTNIVRVYGRTAFFYYLIHWFVVHSICTALFFTRGHNWSFAIKATETNPFLFLIQGEGYSLRVVYLIWVAVIVALYPLCKWYDTYKTSHREKWWLSYL